MTRRSDSRTSENKYGEQLLLTMLNQDRIYEAVAVLRTPTSIIPTPLGITRRGTRLSAKIYPGTRLFQAAAEAYEACISFPLEPSIYIDALVSKQRLAYRRPEAITAPCITPAPLQIETVVNTRQRSNEAILLQMEPIHIRLEPVYCSGYSRALGCTIEALIAITRVQFWSRRYTRRCIEAIKWYRVLLNALECIKHVMTTNTNLHSSISRLATKAEEALNLGGCTQ